MLRNREFFTEAAVLVLLSAVMIVLDFSAPVCCAVLLAAHLAFTGLRYRKLQRLSQDLDALLSQGTPLPIGAYTEGELSILSSQIQKLTLRLTEAAEASAQDKRYLADSLADISHQLRTPLTAMQLTAAMLSDASVTEQRRRELVLELKTLLNRTQWLVDALLKLSKLDAGTVQLAAEQVPVTDLLRRAAAPLAVPMELREQELVLHCREEVFTGDITWSAEALGNLLKNCMEHTPTGGTVTVCASQNPLFTQIDIQDTGPGFREQDLPHLFERFYRGSGESGYGIGLALARTILTAQNGTLRAYNTDHGAAYQIKFYHQVI